MLRLIVRKFSELKPQRCYYKVLNVPTYCTVTDVRVAYLDMAKKYHPDINKEPGAVARFSEIQKAYEMLSEEDKRKSYDEANLIGHKQEQESAKELPKRSQDELEKQRLRFKQKHLYGEQNKRKDELNDQLNFSYKLFRTHFEKIQVEKDNYESFPGNDSQHYERKDYKPRQWHKEYMFVVIPMALIAGYWYLNKRMQPQPARND